MYKKTIPAKLFIPYFLRMCAGMCPFRKGKNPGEEVKGRAVAVVIRDKPPDSGTRFSGAIRHQF